jgi:hypothetical protein
MPATYIVICLADSDYWNGPEYVLSSARNFLHYDDAQRYANTISPARKPIVVQGDWTRFAIRICPPKD